MLSTASKGLKPLISFRNNELTLNKGNTDRRLNGQSGLRIENESDLIDRFLNITQCRFEFIEVPDDGSDQRNI